MNEIPRERQQERQIPKLSDDAEAEEREAVCNCRENETLISTVILKRREHEATVGTCSWQAAPDFANLAETGLGVGSLHFAATSTHWVVFVRVLPNSENLKMASEGLDKVSERGGVEGRGGGGDGGGGRFHLYRWRTMKTADFSHSMNQSLCWWMYLDQRGELAHRQMLEQRRGQT